MCTTAGGTKSYYFLCNFNLASVIEEKLIDYISWSGNRAVFHHWFKDWLYNAYNLQRMYCSIFNCTFIEHLSVLKLISVFRKWRTKANGKLEIFVSKFKRSCFNIGLCFSNMYSISITVVLFCLGNRRRWLCEMSPASCIMFLITSVGSFRIKSFIELFSASIPRPPPDVYRIDKTLFQYSSSQCKQNGISWGNAHTEIVFWASFPVFLTVWCSWTKPNSFEVFQKLFPCAFFKARF